MQQTTSELDTEREENSERTSLHRIEMNEVKQQLKIAHQELKKAQADVKHEAEKTRYGYVLLTFSAVGLEKFLSTALTSMCAYQTVQKTSLSFANA